MRFCILPKQSISRKFGRWRLVSGKEALWLIFCSHSVMTRGQNLQLDQNGCVMMIHSTEGFSTFWCCVPLEFNKDFFRGVLTFHLGAFPTFSTPLILKKNHLKKSPCMNSYTNKIYYTLPPFSSSYNGLKTSS